MTLVNPSDIVRAACVGGSCGELDPDWFTSRVRANGPINQRKSADEWKWQVRQSEGEGRRTTWVQLDPLGRYWSIHS